jgi:2-iminobutanoate/2-iminopropanoate deaminase
LVTYSSVILGNQKKRNMQRFNTPKAPQAIGPYSQATIVNGMIYTSGQIAINPETNELFRGSIEEETKLVLNNIKALLEEASSNLENVIKTTIFIKNMDDFQVINGIYDQFFSTSKPARSTVEVARLPKDVNIEIDVIALVKS